MNNDVILSANNMLSEFADENDIAFIDWAEAIRDDNYNLYRNLSSDGYCHLTVDAYSLLVEYLLCHQVR